MIFLVPIAFSFLSRFLTWLAYMTASANKTSGSLTLVPTIANMDISKSVLFSRSSFLCDYGEYAVVSSFAMFLCFDQFSWSLQRNSSSLSVLNPLTNFRCTTRTEWIFGLNEFCIILIISITASPTKLYGWRIAPSNRRCIPPTVSQNTFHLQMMLLISV